MVICSRKQNAIDEAAETIGKKGGEVLGMAANVSVSAEREKFVGAAMDWAGRIDTLVNNAGSNPRYGPSSDLSEPDGTIKIDRYE